MYENYLDNNMYSFESTDKKYIFTFGIIDILTEYNFQKKCESVYKRNVYGNTVSCQPPDDYANRFYEFMKTQMETDGNTFDGFIKKGKFTGRQHTSPVKQNKGHMPPKKPSNKKEDISPKKKSDSSPIKSVIFYFNYKNSMVTIKEYRAMT